MSAALIIVIVVVLLILIGLALVLPRVGERARVAARERELGERREHVAHEHREAANERAQQAEIADRRARIAEQEPNEKELRLAFIRSGPGTNRAGR